ncbi:MAG: gamma carbonic anhydrase family protein [Candidatus Aenigmarchaeota archaeon]|nr:gamma carbonic anhydrase family protein [Candidatus Aenigmarchaeota archaeon]
MIRPFGGRRPQVHGGVYIAESAEIIGDVMIGRGSSIWPGVVIRGDESPVTIGEHSNVQDNSVIHCCETLPTIIKDYVTLGHGVIAHSTTVNSDCLIGMGAILLNGSEIGERCIIGAGTLVKEGQVIPPGSLAVGVPARVVRPLEDKDIAKIRNNALEYVRLMKKYL